MEFIKPKPIFNIDFSEYLGFKDLKGKKVYRSEYDLETKEEREANELLKIRWKEFITYITENNERVVGYLEDYKGNFIRDIRLYEIIDYASFESEKYTNTWTFTKVAEVTRSYGIFKGLKYKNKGNHLYNWFSRKVIEDNFNNTVVPQKLDDKGYITLLEDKKNSVVVNYGYEGDLLRHELKDVYCSSKGRFIKYKGKNYYIEENN